MYKHPANGIHFYTKEDADRFDEEVEKMMQERAKRLNWDPERSKRTDNKGQGMKKEMLEFLEKNQSPLYYEERQIIKEFLETFFDSYQPESSKREDCNCPNRYLLNGTYMGKYCRCGTPNTMET